MADIERLPALTGLRGVAALWVLLFHAWALAGPASAGLPAPLAAILGAGWLGVDVFFVLSGFLLARGLDGAGVVGTRRDWREYAVMRAARILPAYYAQLAVLSIPVVAIVLTPPVAWSPGAVGEVVAHLLLWLNAWPWVPAHLGPWWSLSVEAGFYLALPLMWLAWPSGRRMMVFVLVTAVLAVAWRAALQANVADIAQRIGWAEHLPGRGVQFAAGMALAWIHVRARTGDDRPPSWLARLRHPGSLAALLAVVALVALPQLGGERPYGGVVDARAWTWFWPLLTTIPVVVLLQSLLASPQSGVARLLGSAPLRALGAISFSLYLWHYPLQWALRTALGGYVPASWGLTGFTFVGLALSVAVATLSWWLVERPALRAARRWRERRRR